MRVLPAGRSSAGRGRGGVGRRVRRPRVELGDDGREAAVHVDAVVAVADGLVERGQAAGCVVEPVGAAGASLERSSIAAYLRDGAS